MNINLSFTREELEKAMTESSVVRGLVLATMFPAKASLQSVIRHGFCFNSGDYIPAIKFLRQYAQNNNLPQYQSLKGAKDFIDGMNWPK